MSEQTHHACIRSIMHACIQMAYANDRRGTAEWRDEGTERDEGSGVRGKRKEKEEEQEEKGGCKR